MKIGDLISPAVDENFDFVYLWETSNFSGDVWDPARYYKFTSLEYGIILCIEGEGKSKEVQIYTSSGCTGWALYDKVILVQCR